MILVYTSMIYHWLHAKTICVKTIKRIHLHFEPSVSVFKHTQTHAISFNQHAFQAYKLQKRSHIICVCGWIHILTVSVRQCAMRPQAIYIRPTRMCSQIAYMCTRSAARRPLSSTDRFGTHFWFWASSTLLISSLLELLDVRQFSCFWILKQ